MVEANIVVVDIEEPCHRVAVGGDIPAGVPFAVVDILVLGDTVEDILEEPFVVVEDILEEPFVVVEDILEEPFGILVLVVEEEPFGRLVAVVLVEHLEAAHLSQLPQGQLFQRNVSLPYEISVCRNRCQPVKEIRRRQQRNEVWGGAYKEHRPLKSNI
jgi:hypothetical protein